MAKKKQSQMKKSKEAAKKSNKKDDKKKSSKKSSKSSVSVKKYQKQIAALKKKADSLDDKYLRAEAEMQNVQRHAARDEAEIRKYGAQSLAKAMVPGLDNLERALQTKVSDKNGKQLKQGVKMVYNRLIKALSENNVKEVKVEGKPFNPEYAQAVQTVSANKKHPADQVVKVLQKGYKINDRVLRPAMVIVAK